MRDGLLLRRKGEVVIVNAVEVLNVMTFGPKCNKPPMQSFNCANIEMLK